jgi:hypothetical protein
VLDDVRVVVHARVEVQQSGPLDLFHVRVGPVEDEERVQARHRADPVVVLPVHDVQGRAVLWDPGGVVMVVMVVMVVSGGMVVMVVMVVVVSSGFVVGARKPGR